MRDSLINRRFQYSFNYVSIILICINVAVYLLTSIYPEAAIRLALVPSLIITRYWYWQFFTYMFVHGSATHLLSNILMLFIFSVILEKKIGSAEYLLYYFITGVLAGVASFIYFYATGQYGAVLIGASGVAYAVALLFAVFFPNARLLLFFVIPIRVPVLVLIYFLVSLFSFMANRNTGVAYGTHLFGILFGYLYIRLRMRIKPLEAFGF